MRYIFQWNMMDFMSILFSNNGKGRQIRLVKIYFIQYQLSAQLTALSLYRHDW